MSADSVHLDDSELEQADFEEERESLDDFEGTLESTITERRARRDAASARAREIRSYSVDADDFANFKAEQTIAQNAEKELVRYESYAANPYFGHVDLRREDGEPTSYYIGDQDVFIGGSQRVVSWRAPIANAFYEKQSRDFVVKGKQYKLLLRRELSIRDAILRSVHTEYDVTRADLPGEVIDPFLIQVLLDKRRTYKISDIIVSIQENQNEIMRQAFDANFIVQGCAGSGKTMILLHRLSYLIYNYPEVDLGRYAVITPGDFFDKNMQELRTRLDIDDIRRFSIVEFYVWLMRELSWTDTYQEEDDGVKKTSQKVAIPHNVNPTEASLGTELLKKCYSEEFLEALRSAIEAGKNDVVRMAEEAGLSPFFEERGLDALPSDGTPYEIYSVLDKNARKMRETILADQDRLESEKANLKSARDAMRETRDRVLDISNRIATARHSVADAINDARSRVTGILEETAAEGLRVEKERLAKEERLAADRDALKRGEAELSSIAGELNRYAHPSEVLEDAEGLAEAYATSCPEEHAGLVEARARLSAMRAENAKAIEGARGAAAEAESAYKEASDNLTERLRVALDTRMSELNDNLNELSSNSKDAEKRESSASERISQLEDDITKIGAELASVRGAGRQLERPDKNLVGLRTIDGSLLENACRSIIEEFDTVAVRRSSLGPFAFRERRRLDDRLEGLRSQAASAALAVLDEIIASLQENLRMAQDELEGEKRNRDEAQSSINEVQALISKVELERSACARAVESSHGGVPRLDDYARQIIGDSPDLTAELRELAVKQGELSELQGEADALAASRESREKGILSDIERIRDDADVAVNSVHADRVRAAEKRRDALASVVEDDAAAVADIEKKFEELAGKRSEIEGELASLEELDSALKAGRATLPQLDDVVRDERLAAAMDAYRVTVDSFTTDEKSLMATSASRIERLTVRIATCTDAVDRAQAAIDGNPCKTLLPKVEECASLLDVRQFLHMLEGMTADLYKESQVTYYPRRNYPHRIYARLALCAEYYGGGRQTRVRHVSIDEAQDISPAEYKVLKAALGPGVTINLYGDNDQLISDYRGTRNWDDIGNIFGTDVFRLDQNYRNSLEVTSYCNETLGKSMMGIGLNGPKVRKTNLSEAVDELFNLRAAGDGKRLAVIYKRGLAGLHEILDDLLGADAVWGDMEGSKITVLDALQAKGLEFDGVVVIDNLMTENELYVSYTRALDSLIIANVPGLGLAQEVDVSRDETELIDVEMNGEDAPDSEPALRRSPRAQDGDHEKKPAREKGDDFDALFAGMDDVVLLADNPEEDGREE